MRELEITPEPGDPAVAAAIARALEQLERERGLSSPTSDGRSAWAAEARREQGGRDAPNLAPIELHGLADSPR